MFYLKIRKDPLKNCLHIITKMAFKHFSKSKCASFFLKDHPNLKFILKDSGFRSKKISEFTEPLNFTNLSYFKEFATCSGMQ